LATTFLLALCLGTGSSTVSAQNAPDPYSIGASIITGSKKSCPLFIGHLAPKSPAEAAGLRPGDRLLAVDGKDVKGTELAQVVSLIRSERPGNVALKLWRDGEEFEVTIPRERFSTIISGEGMKRAGQFIVPLDTTEAEVKRMAELEQRPIAARAFPLHYPLNTDLYCGGFEIFILAHPPHVAVGGLEQGPAFRAGIHQGDVILSVNGIDPTEKSPEELEALFSSNQPKGLELVVDRVTTTKTIDFQLEKASDVLKENHWRLVDGTLVPDGLANEDLPCFTERSRN
jgi:predicted metalloprotease with PDZ domain